MNTRHFFWRLLLYRPAYYFANLLSWAVIHMVPLLPGLITKAFFDDLEGSADFPYGVEGLMALFIGVALARIMLIAVGCWTDGGYRFRISMLLRRNMLAHVLREPGAKAIPCSPGEAISNFRDDVDQTEEAMSWSVDMFGLIGFVAVSSYILISIDAQLTFFVFVPLILVVTAAQSPRRASRNIGPPAAPLRPRSPARSARCSRTFRRFRSRARKGGSYAGSNA
ncbi:hypothetical protein HMSSN139_44180 [Paenibacillus sp. HMSSN-139]|nr:hypothetical protein HMSSN139_44180 [Paenibacillus sp. HMSSN-139]